MRATAPALLLSIVALGCRQSTSPPGGPSGKEGKAGADPSVIDGDLKQMQGKWKLLVSERTKAKFVFGKEATDNILTITGDKMVQGSLRRDWMQAKLDPAKTPKAMDLVFFQQDGTAVKKYFTWPDGRVEIEEGRVSGIYELQGDHLKICFPDSLKTPRPTDFTIGPENDRVAMTLQRIK